MLAECDEADVDVILTELETAKAKQSFTSFCKEQAERLVKANRLHTSETYMSAFKSFMRFRGDENIMFYESMPR